MLEYTPPGCGPGDPHPPSVGLDTPQVWAWRSPWVWAWRPPGCGPGNPPFARPLKLPLGCGLGNLQRMLGYTPLETCKACWDTTCKACWDTTTPPPVNRITDTCKNITFPQLRLRTVIKPSCPNGHSGFILIIHSSSCFIHCTQNA